MLNELLKTSPNDTRAARTCCRAPSARAATEGGRSHRAQDHARSIRPASPACTRWCWCCSIASTIKQVVEVVAPLAKDPPRAKGREIEGAAVLVQLGHRAAAARRTRTRRSPPSPRRKSLTPDDPRDRRLPGPGAPHRAALRSRRGAGARSAGARSRSAADGPPARAGACRRAARPPKPSSCSKTAWRRSPNSREYVVGLADLYAEQKRTDDALRVLEQARKTFGDDETLTMRLANVVRSRRPAGRSGERAAAADGRGSAQRQRAQLARATCSPITALRLPEAVDLAAARVEDRARQPAYLDTLGWALFKQGKAEEADAPLSQRRRRADRQLGDPGSSRRRARQARPQAPRRSPPGSARWPATASRSIAPRSKRRSRPRKRPTANDHCRHRTALADVLVAIVLAARACAARMPPRPAGTPTPDPDRRRGVHHGHRRLPRLPIASKGSCRCRAAPAASACAAASSPASSPAARCASKAWRRSARRSSSSPDAPSARRCCCRASIAC